MSRTSSLYNSVPKWWQEFAESRLGTNQMPSFTEAKENLLTQSSSPCDTAVIEDYGSQPCRQSTLIRISLLLALLGNVMFVFVFVNIKSLAPRLMDLEQNCSSQNAMYRSPMDDSVPIRYQTVQFTDGINGEQSRYAQSASQNVDDAWAELGIHYNHLVVAEDDDVINYGVSPWQVKRDPALGGGYLVYIEALHQLHCLNTIRKSLQFDFEYYHGNKTSNPIIQAHTYHCVDMLRQRIQCSGDREVFGMVWMEDKDLEYSAHPQYSTTKKCRNFDDIVSWTQGQDIGEDSYHSRTYRPGDRVFTSDGELL